MYIFHSPFAAITLESGTLDHAVRVCWKKPCTDEQYLEVLRKVQEMFAEYATFSVFVMDNTFMSGISKDALRWTLQDFIPSLAHKVTHVYYQGPATPIPWEYTPAIVAAFESQGTITHYPEDPEELQALVAAL